MTRRRPQIAPPGAPPRVGIGPRRAAVSIAVAAILVAAAPLVPRAARAQTDQTQTDQTQTDDLTDPGARNGRETGADATTSAAMVAPGAENGGGELDAALTQRLEAPEEPAPGDPVALVLDIDHPKGARVVAPEDEAGNERWRFLDRQTSTRAAADGARATTTLTYRFGIYRPGKTTLPPFEVTVEGPAGRSRRTLRTEPITVRVRSTLPDDAEAKMRSARPGYAIFTEDWTLVYAMAGGALLLVLLPAVWFAARRRERAASPPPPPRPAHEIAVEKLGALAADDLLERGEFEAFYVRMSEAIREYLGQRYGFPGTELTTYEILERLDGVRWRPGIDLEDVREWLVHCDVVKFSGKPVTVAEAESALRRAFSLIELTRRRTPRSGEMPEDAEKLLEDEERERREISDENRAALADADEATESGELPEVDDHELPRQDARRDGVESPEDASLVDDESAAVEESNDDGGEASGDAGEVGDGSASGDERDDGDEPRETDEPDAEVP